MATPSYAKRARATAVTLLMQQRFDFWTSVYHYDADSLAWRCRFDVTGDLQSELLS